MPPPDERRCTAKSKQSGERCKAYALRGKSVCRIHGGKSPSGPAASNFRHGRYSKYLPTGLAGKYKEALADPDLLAMRAELALIDARVVEILEAGEPGRKEWREIEGWIELRRRVGDSERKRLVDLQQMMTAEQAMTLLSVVLDAVKSHVNDKRILAAISQDIGRLVAPGIPAAVEPGEYDPSIS